MSKHTQTGIGRGKNPKSRANLAPPFDGSKAGPGRPPMPPDIKDAIKETKAILKNLSPFAAMRLGQLAGSAFGNIAVAASRAILEKTVPTLEEVTNHDDRPLQQFSDEQLAKKLDELNAGRASHTNGNGASAQ
jgi:hypothetical protein